MIIKEQVLLHGHIFEMHCQGRHRSLVCTLSGCHLRMPWTPKSLRTREPGVTLGYWGCGRQLV